MFCVHLPSTVTQYVEVSEWFIDAVNFSPAYIFCLFGFFFFLVLLLKYSSSACFLWPCWKLGMCTIFTLHDFLYNPVCVACYTSFFFFFFLINGNHFWYLFGGVLLMWMLSYSFCLYFSLHSKPCPKSLFMSWKFGEVMEFENDKHLQWTWAKWL